MRLFKLCVASVCIISLFACKDDEVTKNESKNGVVNGEVSKSAFTITVNSSFSGLTFNERTYGSFGVFYCEYGKGSDDSFEAWEKGGKIESADIIMKYGDILKAGDCMEMHLEGLKPNTEYLVCTFFESESGRRMIGRSERVKTNEFKVSLKNTGAVSPKYFTATLSANVSGLDPEDCKFCSIGFVCSTEANPTIENGMVFRDVNEKVANKDYSLRAKGLDVLTEYHYVPYLVVNTINSYYYGDDKTFSTLDYEENAVDLGTGILVSRYFLGAESEDEYGDLYRWGEVTPVKSGIPYALFDANTLNYVELNVSNISGTEYDAVKKRIGGKWRMPTAAEMDSIMKVCDFLPVRNKDIYKTKLTFKSKITGKSVTYPQSGYGYSYGNSLNRIRYYDPYGSFYIWTGDFIREEFTSRRFVGLTDSQLDDYLDQYIDIIISTTTSSGSIVIYLDDFYAWLEEQNLGHYEDRLMKVNYIYFYRPNNWMDEMDYYDSGELKLNDDKWSLRLYSDYGDDAYNMLPVRDKD